MITKKEGDILGFQLGTSAAAAMAVLCTGWNLSELWISFSCSSSSKPKTEERSERNGKWNENMWLALPADTRVVSKDCLESFNLFQDTLCLKRRVHNVDIIALCCVWQVALLLDYKTSQEPTFPWNLHWACDRLTLQCPSPPPRWWWFVRASLPLIGAATNNTRRIPKLLGDIFRITWDFLSKLDLNPRSHFLSSAHWRQGSHKSIPNHFTESDFLRQIWRYTRQLLPAASCHLGHRRKGRQVWSSFNEDTTTGWPSTLF